MRQVVLDTETTGLEPAEGHRVIEIGAVELVDRRLTGRHYHQYLNPDREIDAGAVEVHGITQAFLADKPRFGDVADQFLEFIEGAELVIHNAPFDVAFLDHEIGRWRRDAPPVASRCGVLDTLQLARSMHPGQRNSLDALCKRYAVDDSQRELHGALLDAEILADVYLTMTGGQTALALGEDDTQVATGLREDTPQLIERHGELKVIRADAEELAAHEARLDAIDIASDGAIWRRPL